MLIKLWRPLFAADDMTAGGGAEETLNETVEDTTDSEPSAEETTQDTDSQDVDTDDTGGEAATETGEGDDLEAPRIPRSRLNQEIEAKKEAVSKLNQYEQLFQTPGVLQAVLAVVNGGGNATTEQQPLVPEGEQPIKPLTPDEIEELEAYYPASEVQRRIEERGEAIRSQQFRAQAQQAATTSQTDKLLAQYNAALTPLTTADSITLTADEDKKLQVTAAGIFTAQQNANMPVTVEDATRLAYAALSAGFKDVREKAKQTALQRRTATTQTAKAATLTGAPRQTGGSGPSAPREGMSLQEMEAADYLEHFGE